MRKYSSQKKGEKDTKYKTRRGFYMDYDLKVASTVPGAGTDVLICREVQQYARVLERLKTQKEVPQQEAGPQTN